MTLQAGPKGHVTSKAPGFGGVAYPVGDHVEPVQIEELPAHEPVAEVLDALAPALLVLRHAVQVVLAQAVGLTHDTPLGEEKVDAGDEVSEPVSKLRLQCGCRQVIPPDRQAAERFQDRLAAGIAEVDRSPRGAGARPSPTRVEHVAQTATRHDPLSQGRVRGDHGLRQAVFATQIDDRARCGGDGYTGKRIQVSRNQAGAVQMHVRLAG